MDNHIFYEDKFNLMNLRIWEIPLEMSSACMRKEKEKILFRNIGRIRRINHIREERDSNLLSRETILKDIIKNNLLRMDPKWKTLWGKWEGYQSNVGDVKNISCTKIVFVEKTK